MTYTHPEFGHPAEYVKSVENAEQEIKDRVLALRENLTSLIQYKAGSGMAIIRDEASFRENPDLGFLNEMDHNLYILERLLEGPRK